MENLSLSIADLSNIDILSKMNFELIEDEEYDQKTLSPPKLKERMRGFLQAHYIAYLFKINTNVIGYCLIDMEKEPLYLRHFFIDRGQRRRGYGTQAIKLLLNELNIDQLDVEVMVWNDEGRSFWRSVGFEPRYEGLRYCCLRHDNA